MDIRVLPFPLLNRIFGQLDPVTLRIGIDLLNIIEEQAFPASDLQDPERPAPHIFLQVFDEPSAKEVLF